MSIRSSWVKKYPNWSKLSKRYTLKTNKNAFFTPICDNVRHFHHHFAFVSKGVWPAKPQSQITGPWGREAAGAGGRAAGEGGEMHRGRPQAHWSGKQLQVERRQERQSVRNMVPSWTESWTSVFSVPASPSGLLVRPQRTLTPPGVTLCFRSFFVGGGRCTGSSLSSTWRGMREGRTRPAPTVRLASKELRSTRAC